MVHLLVLSKAGHLLRLCSFVGLLLLLILLSGRSIDIAEWIVTNWVSLTAAEIESIGVGSLWYPEALLNTYHISRARFGESSLLGRATGTGVALTLSVNLAARGTLAIAEDLLLQVKYSLFVSNNVHFLSHGLDQVNLRLVLNRLGDELSILF